MTDKSRGFGFVEYELEEDCLAALENMHGAELLGKVLRCNIAKPVVNTSRGAAVWNAENWIHNQLKSDDNFGELEKLDNESLNPTE